MRSTRLLCAVKARENGTGAEMCPAIVSGIVIGDAPSAIGQFFAFRSNSPRRTNVNFFRFLSGELFVTGENLGRRLISTWLRNLNLTSGYTWT